MRILGLNITRNKVNSEQRSEFSNTSTSKELAEEGIWLSSTVNSGVTINEDNSMSISTVLQCLRVLCDGVASLPMHLYKEVGESREKNKKHYLYKKLNMKPNKEITSFTFYERVIIDLPIWGNHYSYIRRDFSGKIEGIYPLVAGWVYPDRDENGEIFYRVYYEEKGKYKFDILYPSEVLHIVGFGYDGLKGKSLITLARETYGLSKATEQFGAKFFGQGTHLGGIVEAKESFSDEAYERLKRELNSEHSGLLNAHKIRILEEGMTYKSLGMPLEDAQFLETRKFQRAEIAGIFKVPLHMIGDLERATFSNIEQQSIEFVMNTLRPWLIRIEQALWDKLLSEKEQETMFFEFDMNGALRGDYKSRMEGYAIGVNNGIFTRNEVRAWENMNSIEGGDQLLVQVNMTPAELLTEQVKANIESKKSGKDAGIQNGNEGIANK